jgi:hypothetical protein
MAVKGCFGCLKEVEDTLNSRGLATICEGCRYDLDKIPPRFSRTQKCHYCGGETNLIGAVIFRKLPQPWPVCLYFDCPNPACSRNRMSVVWTGLGVAQAKPVSGIQ